MEAISWKMGIEIELLAPAGKTRCDLADLLAVALNQSASAGSVKRIFYPQSEPSKVVGMPVFENLVLGFQSLDGDGKLLATCVDDLTLRANLKREAASLNGWYRIISDDKRFLNLIMAQCDPSAGQAEVLKPLARLFDMPLARPDKGLFQVTDAAASSVAMAATLPGERHRPCELISPPLENNHWQWLETAMSAAKQLNFSVPREAAVHLHFDAAKLRSAKVFSKAVRFFDANGKILRHLVATNPNCTRLGKLPPDLVAMVKQKDFANLGWPQARSRLRTLELDKHCDFNFLNMVAEIPGKKTFEIRILPGTLSAEEVYGNARLFEAILDWCCNDQSPEVLPSMSDVLEQCSLSEAEKEHWRSLQKH